MGQTETIENIDPGDHGLKRSEEKAEFFEEEAGLGGFKSPLILSFDEKLLFNSSKVEEKRFDRFKNYGALPVHVIHNLVLFFQPIDLINLFCTCKLFNEVSTTNHFWECYYHHYYGVDMKKNDNLELNWKKMFMKKFRRQELAEHQFLRRYDIIEKSLPSEDLRKADRIFGVIGKEGVGKRSFLHRFLKDSYRDNSSFENVDFSVSDLSDDFDDVLSDLNNNRFRICIVDHTKNMKDTENFQGFLLCYDVCDADSFKFLEKYLKTELFLESKLCKDTDLSKHRFNIVVVATKCSVGKRQMVNFVRKNWLKGYVETSAKNGCNIYLPVGVLYERLKKLEEEEIEDDFEIDFDDDEDEYPFDEDEVCYV